jgi:hypothetical protein
MNRARAMSLLAGLAIAGGAFGADARWCLGFDGLGPIRPGMTVDQVLPLADFSGLERTRQAEGCWYLRYEGGPSEFFLMIIDGKVARVELRGGTLHTYSGAHVGMTQTALEQMYGARLDSQPHKYDAAGRVYVLRAGSGESGLRFETSKGKVTAIQAGPWEPLNLVEGCS